MGDDIRISAARPDEHADVRISCAAACALFNCNLAPPRSMPPPGCASPLMEMPAGLRVAAADANLSSTYVLNSAQLIGLPAIGWPACMPPLIIPTAYTSSRQTTVQLCEPIGAD